MARKSKWAAFVLAAVFLSAGWTASASEVTPQEKKLIRAAKKFKGIRTKWQDIFR